MADLRMADMDALEPERAPLPRLDAPAHNPLLEGAILPTLLRLAWPNVVALSAGTCVVIAETSYIGRLGTESLAAMALVFPFVMLMMTTSGGAMGGGVSSAISRALGAGDVERASTLAIHALLIGLSFGLTFTVLMLLFGSSLLEQLGGRGSVLEQARGYIQIFFGGAIIPWLMNTFAAVLRGTGNMKLPSIIMLNSAAMQIVLGGVLGLGLGPVPQFGMRGVASGTLIAFTTGVAIMAWYVFSGRSKLKPTLRGFRIEGALFVDILRVGAISCFSPLQSVLTITVVTRFLAGYGVAVLAGYGIGARLEFMLSSLAFAIGVASVPMVGMAIGAGRVARARRIAWISGLVSFATVGFFGTLVAVFPDLWVNMFTDDQGVRDASHAYLATAAPMYAFLGLSTSMYFASQGAAKVIGPVLAQSARLVFIAIGGWWLSARGASAQDFFYLAAASMVVLGLLSAAAVMWTRWGDRAGAAPPIQPEVV
jgi:putative MATE family efflux protein